MTLIKSKIAAFSLPLCLLFSQATLADMSPYIGYEHSFNNENKWAHHPVRYTPRFYFGVKPISLKGYELGIETGYFFPSSYKYTNYAQQESSVRNHRFDLSFVAYKPLGDHAHWFVKPGMEFFLKHFDGQGIYFMPHPIIRTGIGYTFNNKIGVNLISGLRLNSIIHHQDKGNMLFTLDVHYKW